MQIRSRTPEFDVVYRSLSLSLELLSFCQEIKGAFALASSETKEEMREICIKRNVHVNTRGSAQRESWVPRSTMYSFCSE